MHILNKETKPFLLKDVFEIKKAINVSNDFLEAGATNYVTRTKYNNGVLKQIRATNLPKQKGNCIIIGGESALAFYEDEEFVAGNNITCLYNKNLNKFNGLYIVTILNLQTIKFNYARAWNKQNIENTIVQLPTNKDGKIDFVYMTNFISKIYKKQLDKFYNKEVSQVR